MDWTKSRGLFYLLALGAGGLALSGYADFDPQTWVLDIHPFNLKEFVLTGMTTAGNALAGLAVWRRWYCNATYFVLEEVFVLLLVVGICCVAEHIEILLLFE